MHDPGIPAALRRLVDGFVGPDALPAGGAAGVAAIAIGAAVGAKAIRMSSPGAPDAGREASELESLVERATTEFTADCDAFADLLGAFERPRETPGRDEAIRSAWRAATEAPVRVARLAAEADRLLARCADAVKHDLRGDLHAARILIRAGLDIAVNNAEENARRLSPEIAEHTLGGLPDLDAAE